mgnify:CR=1 FL=1|jgi:hypothetical protein
MVRCHLSPAGAFGQDDRHGALAFAATGLQPTAPPRVNISGTRGTASSAAAASAAASAAAAAINQIVHR